jgi:hypothetical protein
LFFVILHANTSQSARSAQSLFESDQCSSFIPGEIPKRSLFPLTDLTLQKKGPEVSPPGICLHVPRGFAQLPVTDFSTQRNVLLCRDDCPPRAFPNTNLAAVTAMHVDDRGLVSVDAEDGPDLTRLLGQTAPTSLATIIVYVKRSFANGGTYQRHYSSY